MRKLFLHLIERTGIPGIGGLIVLALIASGCATQGQTGALTGGGLGALAGQVIGGDTRATLIGAGVGAGIGYLIGNEEDKRKAESMSRRTASVNYAHKEGTSPLAGTKWELISLNEPTGYEYASILVHFESDGHVTTTTTKPNGKVEIDEENYRVVGDTLIVNKPGYLINAKYRVTGDQMTMSAREFSAVFARSN